MNNNNVIDWTLVIINNPIPLYLPRYDIIYLSLTSKLVRSKLVPIIYNTIIINEKFLSNKPNYFMKHAFLFEYNNSLLNLWLIAKHRFNRELAFKEAHIDPFIKEFNDNLKPRAIQYKKLYFEYLGNALYYLFPITYEFQNLRTLYFYKCVLSLEQFSSALEKLYKLEVLVLRDIKLIESPYSFSTNRVFFPQSLHSLTYFYVRSCSISLPLDKPLEFLNIKNSTNISPDCNIIPQFLPKLKKFHYFSRNLEKELLKFLDINWKIEDLSLHIMFLSCIIPDKNFLTCLKKLELYDTDTDSNDVPVNNTNIPGLCNLEELKLVLNTNAQLEYSKLLINNCPKLYALDARSCILKRCKLRELIKCAKNLKYYNGERLL